MSPVDEILAQVPLGDLATRLGVDEATAERAARQALPALLGGIQANADDPAGAASFASAVQQHDQKLIDGGVDLADVDTADGDRIVGHVFGAQRDQVVNQLGGLGALGAPAGAAPAGVQAAVGGEGSSGLIAKLLPILAPIVMSYLAKKLAGGSTGTGGAPASGGGLGDLLGGILGSATGGTQGGAGGGLLGGGLGDLLGGLLGGGRK